MKRKRPRIPLSKDPRMDRLEEIFKSHDPDRRGAFEDELDRMVIKEEMDNGTESSEDC